MAPTWTAEIVVDAVLAARLIAAQFPALAPVHLEPFGEGFDNTAYLVHGTWVFRFPRRAIAVATIEAELRGLPRLAGRLPLPAPVPEFTGAPSEAYPWPFVGYRLLPGRPACRARLTDAQRAAAAEPLAAFLRALHAQPVDPAVHSTDMCSRTNFDILVPRAHENFSQLVAEKHIDDDAALQALVDSVPEDWAPSADTLVHGDLYACHVLVDAEGAPAAVIDWGDIHRGDPAVDLALVYGFLPAAARPAFWRVYGDVSEVRRRVARLRAASHAAMLLRYAHDLHDAALVADTLDTLRRATEN